MRTTPRYLLSVSSTKAVQAGTIPAMQQGSFQAHVQQWKSHNPRHPLGHHSAKGERHLWAWLSLAAMVSVICASLPHSYLALQKSAEPVSAPADEFQQARERLVHEEIEARGVHDARVLAAMRKVPRHLFVPPDQQKSAYVDSPLFIGFSQTISEPYLVAFMTEALELKPHDRVLEIGTGSGYQAAVLAELAGEIYTIEIVEPLAQRAEADLKRLGYTNIHVRAGDGYKGWPEAAPFDAIIVTCAPEKVPPPPVRNQENGRA